MAATLTQYRVFISSPKGLEEERKAFYKEVNDYDEIDARPRGVSFLAIGSEKVVPEYGRPQSIINKELYNCDYFVLVLWDRWGTPPGTLDQTVYSSGSEEEFNEAVNCLSKKIICGIVVMFKEIENTELANQDEQLQKVIKFKKKLETDQTLFYQKFSSTEDFRKILRRCLAKWVQHHVSKIAKVPVEKTVLEYERPGENVGN